MSKLIIDTSTDRALLALSEEGKIVKEMTFTARQLSEELFPSLEALLGKTTPEAIAIGTGPGSFAGTRTAMTAGKTLSFAWNIPLLTFPSTLALLPLDHQGPYRLVLDAKMGQVALVEGDTETDKLSIELFDPADLPQTEIFTPCTPHLLLVARFIEKKREVLEPKITYLRC